MASEAGTATLLALEQAAQGARVTLADQITEAEKTVRERVRSWPQRIEAGRITVPKAGHKLAAMRAIASTLRWLAANEAWIKAEHARRTEALSIVREHFPDAEIVDPEREDQDAA